MNHKIITTAALLCLPLTAYAEGLSNDGMQQAYKLYENMTPAQKAAVEKAALQYQKKLASMTPEQRDQVTGQASEISETISFEKIDTNKLNTKKIVSYDKTQKNFNEYQKKYEAGKIKNAVIKAE